MLETGEVLATWALGQSPDAPGPLAARRLPDHRRHYLDYEGPLSGDRGSVARWDAGHYTLCRHAEDCWEIDLEGQQLHGRITLQRSAPAGEEWEFRRD